MARLKASPSPESFFITSLKPSSSESLSAALVRFRRFLRSLRRVVSALDSEFVELALIYCFCDALFIVQSSTNFIPSFATVLAFQAVDIIGP